MENLVFTQLSILEVRQLLRQELEAFFVQRSNASAEPKHTKRMLVDIDRACEITGLAKPTIYALAPKGQIPNFKKGRKLYFYEDELVAWIEGGRRLTQAEIEEGACGILKKGKGGR